MSVHNHYQKTEFSVPERDCKMTTLHCSGRKQAKRCPPSIPKLEDAFEFPTRFGIRLCPSLSSMRIHVVFTLFRVHEEGYDNGVG